jgi:phosphopantothenoylcysteine decarboxylase/phosphopantothenate--cysteine ligase
MDMPAKAGRGSIGMTELSGRRILLIIGGGIAAYKSLDLIRRLRERNVRVRAVLTAAAKHFVTPLSVASLTGEKIHDDLFSLTGEAGMGHIELSRDADLLVIAPATADLLAKMAHGLADDLASTLLLATDKKTLVAPAMNLRMWLAPATRRNIAALRSDGVLFSGPAEGAMACGEFGPGRMSEPLDILEAIEAALAGPTDLPLPANLASGEALAGMLLGRKVVVTSGPTHEPIDPVRFIANRSTGKQGHAIARAAAAAGADVVLVSGPVALSDPLGVETIHVETAIEMLSAVEAALPADLFIGVAAVADWRAETPGVEKIKKSGAAPPVLRLVENPDILALVAAREAGRPRIVVGFAAETESHLEHARLKLAAKGCDMILANDVGGSGGVMGKDSNKVTLLTAGSEDPWPAMSKNEVAAKLVETLAARLGGERP